MSDYSDIKSLILDRKSINDTEYQILNTKNEFNDICCAIVKINGKQFIEIGQFTNVETAKEVLGKLDGDENIGRRVKIKNKNSEDVYIGEVKLWTFGEFGRVEILGNKESEQDQRHLIFYKYDGNSNELIESCEFID